MRYRSLDGLCAHRTRCSMGKTMLLRAAQPGRGRRGVRSLAGIFEPWIESTCPGAAKNGRLGTDLPADNLLILNSFGGKLATSSKESTVGQDRAPNAGVALAREWQVFRAGDVNCANILWVDKRNAAWCLCWKSRRSGPADHLARAVDLCATETGLQAASGQITTRDSRY